MLKLEVGTNQKYDGMAGLQDIGEGTPRYGETFPRKHTMVNEGTRKNSPDIVIPVIFNVGLSGNIAILAV